MRTSLRSRLFLSHLVVLLIGMSLAAGLAWLVVAEVYLRTQRDNLLAQAQLIAAALQDQPLPEMAVQPYSQITNISPGIHTRLLSPSGAVVLSLPAVRGDSSFLPAPAAENRSSVSVEELMSRPEIRQALQGKPGWAIRTITGTENRRVLYIATPVLAITRALPGEDSNTNPASSVPPSNGSTPLPITNVRGVVYLATPLPSTGAPAEMLWRLGGVFLVAIVLAGVAAKWLTQALSRPIEAFARAAHRISIGELNYESGAHSNILEIDQLSQAFDSMTASLRQSEQIRNAFIADVAHELRTPLTVVKGAIETLEDGAMDDVQGRSEMLALMRRESERLERLVNDLLLLTRADAGALSLHTQPIDLVALAQARCESLTRVADLKGITLQVKNMAVSPPPLALGDPDRLVQVFDNLLDNAIRHSPPGGTVTIAIQSDMGAVHCTVSDKGAGIPPEHLPHIFERFYRADAARDRQSGGAGLGLSIARALIIAMQGNIQAKSEAGKGTSICFHLPSSPEN